MFFYFHIYLIKGETEVLQQSDLLARNGAAEGENRRKKYSVLNRPWQVCRFQKEDKALAWWNAAREEKEQSMRCFLVFKFMFWQKQETQQRKKWNGFFGKDQYKEESWEPQICQQRQNFPPSQISAIWDTVPLKYNRPTDRFNGVKCGKVTHGPVWKITQIGSVLHSWQMDTSCTDRFNRRLIYEL